LLAFSAQEGWAKTNYKNHLIGGRAALLGGAFTAVSDDSTAIFYNPAGMAYVPGSNVSGSGNLYSINSQSYEGVIGREDWQRKSENLTPSYFGMSRKSKRWTLGLGFAQLDKVKENQNQVFENVDAGAGLMNYYSLVMSTEDNHYLFAMSAAYETSSTFSLGLTLSYSLRHYLRHQDQYTRYADTDTEHAFDYKEIKSKDLKPTLGFLWSPREKWSLGLTASKDLIFPQITEDVRNRLDKGSSTPAFVRQTSQGKDQTPLELALGTAFFPSPSLLYSVNLEYFLESASGRNDVINLSLGSEYFFSPQYALRAGLFTNRSNVAEYNRVARNLDQRVHIYGLSAGLGYFTPTTELTGGVIASRGRGEIQPYSGSVAVRSFTYFDLKFLLASSYNF